jgi:predicted HAD superfamily phosphohydrolase YqeG
MRPVYDRLATLDEVLARAGELSAKTLVFDVEPLIAHWESGQEALDQGLEVVLARARAIPGVAVVCFSTNSVRRPSAPLAGDGARAVYLASAAKPLRTAFYQSFPRPGVVIGDQLGTDGALARRLGYAFLQFRPDPRNTPVGPRVLDWLGGVVRPLLFARPQKTRD